MILLRRLRRVISGLVAGVVFFAGGGCGYNSASERFMKPYAGGDYTLAVAEVQKLDKKSNANDKLIFKLEHGALLRAAGQLQASNAILDEADQKVTEFENGPEVHLSRESAGLVTNLTTLDYTGYGYDRIMLNVYKSLNFMELGEMENARVELQRAYNRQKDAVRKNAERIEEANKVANENKADDPNSLDVRQTIQNPDLERKLNAGVKSSLADFSSYAEYVNPFAEYLQGIFILATNSGPGDREIAATTLRRTAGMVGGNPYVLQDLELAEKLPPGAEMPPTTYVILETGIAPDREEIRLDLPIYLVSRRLPYVGVAFPKLRMHAGHLTGITVNTSAGSYPTAVVSSMDSVVSREFYDELPVVITKTIIAAGTKAALTYVANEAVKKKGAVVQIAVFLGTFVAEYALNQADLRTWNTLPKQFEVARFPTPADRTVSLQLPYGIKGGRNATIAPIQIGDGVVNVIYIKSVLSGTPLVVRQFKLK